MRLLTALLVIAVVDAQDEGLDQTNVFPIERRRNWLYMNSNLGRTLAGERLSPWQIHETAQANNPYQLNTYWQTLQNDKTIFDAINDETPYMLDGLYARKGYGNRPTSMFGVYDPGERQTAGIARQVNFGNVRATPRRANLFDEWRDGYFSRTLMRGASNTNRRVNEIKAANARKGAFPYVPPALEKEQYKISQQYRQRISDPNNPLPQGPPQTDYNVYEYQDYDPFAPLLNEYGAAVGPTSANGK